jgi:hypothetical protein
MFKIKFTVQGTNRLEALQRLQTVGLDPTEFAGEITVEADDYEPVRSMVEDLGVSEWSAEQVR